MVRVAFLHAWFEAEGVTERQSDRATELHPARARARQACWGAWLATVGSSRHHGARLRERVCSWDDVRKSLCS